MDGNRDARSGHGNHWIELLQRRCDCDWSCQFSADRRRGLQHWRGPDPNSYADSDSDSYRNSYSHADGYSNSYANAGSVAYSYA